MAKTHNSPKPSFRTPVVICLLLAATVAVVYWPVRGFDFVNLDDPIFVTSNPQVLAGLTWPGVRWAFEFGHADYWHPLTWLSLMLDIAFFGPGASGLHCVNVFLHAANSVLLFLLLRAWTRAEGRSALVAALFALHPLRVESVAWITERKDVLSTLFFLLALAAYGRYARAPRTARKIPYGAALALFACGLMSKSAIVTLPFLLLLLDIWPLRRMPAGNAADFRKQVSRLLWEKIPFFTLTVLFSWLTYRAQHRLEDPSSPDLPLWGRICGAFIACGRYLEQTFWPFNLAVFYPRPAQWPVVEVIGSIFLITGLCIVAFGAVRRRPHLFVGWFWFCGTLVPVLGLAPHSFQFMADRFTYIPSIGLFIGLVWGVHEAVQRHTQFVRAAHIAALAALALCAVRARDQLRHWPNSESLFRHALAVTEDNALAHNNLGYFLEGTGRKSEAADEYREAVRLFPDYARAITSLGRIEYEDGRVADAIDHFIRALAAVPNYAPAHVNLGIAFAAAGRLDDAAAHYRAALQINPGMLNARTDLGSVLIAQGKVDGAIDEYRAALQTAPDFAPLYNNLGYALALKGRVNDAIDCYRSAIRLDPNSSSACYNLGLALASAGRDEEAVASFRDALRIHFDQPKVSVHLARALMRLGRREEAAEAVAEALRRQPGNREALDLQKELRAMPAEH
jgi:tetratricopeptide (TPR) repeat protein